MKTNQHIIKMVILLVFCHTSSMVQTKETFRNPVIYADVPDMSVTRAEEYYYMISTTMHLMPGGPVMKSKDSVHWETVGYVFKEGDWYGLIFQDRGGIGRVPILMPCRWIEGWPMLGDKDRHVPLTMRKITFTGFILFISGPASPTQYNLIAETGHCHTIGGKRRSKPSKTPHSVSRSGNSVFACEII